MGSASSVTVNLSDGSKLAGTVVGADASSDIAVVKVDPVMGPTMGMGYDCVEEGSFACSRWVPKVWVRPPVLVAASHVPSFVDMRRKQ